MSDNQNPQPYDAVLGGQNQPSAYAAVLGGIEGVKKKLNNSNPQIRIIAVEQALNYKEGGIDLIIKALKDESPLVQAKAYSILTPRNEIKVKKALQEFQPLGLKLELIEVVTVNRSGEIIQRQQSLAKYYTENLDKIIQRQLYRKQRLREYLLEDLGNDKTLEMAYIPGGTFIMGSPQTERLSDNNERPQHQVTIKPFFMGKYPVTQAQWRAVAQLPKINLDLDADSRYFGGKNRPVCDITWHDAVEFCSRLSKATGKKYGLPSEAEWEYACRAGTTTPFHYGKTITGELANYRADNTYLNEPKGEWRNQLTSVGQFPPNAFGLYDMHGNVWEWCQDTWHRNHNKAPLNGNPRIYQGSNKRVLRGGSWNLNPEYSRSAKRFELGDSYIPLGYYVGFRVTCNVF
ncbi:MAG: SUMF1/EgtB/PvdO family nonheme iron enzyme [Cyanobacteria bacterium P01_C01_bin.38]